jgi:predicted nucleic acid-binding protein
MKYLLDTDTLIDLSKGYRQVPSRIAELLDQGHTLGICSINVAEFFSGLPEDVRKRWDAELLVNLTYWHVTYEAARQAGSDRHAAARSGTSIPVTDALVAAVAREHDAVILTSNIKDYPMPDVRLLSLRA